MTRLPERRSRMGFHRGDEEYAIIVNYHYGEGVNFCGKANDSTAFLELQPDERAILRSGTVPSAYRRDLRCASL
jgi:hypothetical protein